MVNMYSHYHRIQVEIEGATAGVVDTATSRLVNARIMIMVIYLSYLHMVNLKKIGNCKYGATCSFAHGDGEVRRMNDPEQ